MAFLFVRPDLSVAKTPQLLRKQEGAVFIYPADDFPQTLVTGIFLTEEYVW